MNAHSAVVSCSVYKNGRKLGDVSLDAISEHLKEPDTFVWVGLLEPDEELLRMMQDEFELHELAVEDARNAHQRPKLEEYGETLFVVLHTAHLIERTIHFGETHIFVGPRFVLTVRHGPSIGYRRVRERCESLPERLATGPGYVLYAIIDFVVDQYQPCMDNLQSRFRYLEEELFSPTSQNDYLQDFYQIKNELLGLESAASPLIDVCNRLLRFHGEIVPKESRVYYRDILDHVSRIVQTSDRMREMINAAMQVALAGITIRQNEVVKRLASWGAILAVPTMMFSLYGMNFHTMPELDWKYGYPTVLATVTIGCVILYRRFRRIGWL
ncbi:magnesium transporter [Noviherbaspirillum humi]|uniref:Magnesium transport protein CorA n=1 Tax=Noviherbaspirillum humi TaxID=1688639 RepID=A0A239LDG6_9BURK|nr:magnesium/cobalt transporter CorA [Noviherbaspirillum humi]SNT28531.1 magnesium transporter [Noviherbaspirillum humi]